MMTTLVLAVLAVQAPSIESLIDRLKWSDPKDREVAAAKIAAAGPAALAELDKAAGRIKEPDVLDRMEQVRARIRLKLYTPAMDEGFSPAYRKAAPELIVKLRTPSRDIILEGLESTTGYRLGFDSFQGRVIPISGTKAPEATQADATRVFRIALSILPIRDDSASWHAVKLLLGCCSFLRKTEALMEDGLVHLQDPDSEFRVVLNSQAGSLQRRHLAPRYLRLLDGPSAVHAAYKLQRMNPLEHADRIAALIPDAGTQVQACLIESLSRTGDGRWKDLYLKHVDHSDPWVRTAAVRAVATLDIQAAIPHVVRMLKSEDVALRMAGLQAVPPGSDPRIRGELEKIILHGKDERASQQALFPLWLDASDEVLPIFEKAAVHSFDSVRKTALRHLEYMKRAAVRTAAGPTQLVEPNDPQGVTKLIELLEDENEQGAISDLLKIRSPKLYEDLVNLKMEWSPDRYPTVKETLDSAKGAMKTIGSALEWKLAAGDEKSPIRRNSSTTVVALIFWLIPSTLGNEYGWFVEEGKLSLLPIDEARAQWRAWARSK